MELIFKWPLFSLLLKFVLKKVWVTDPRMYERVVRGNPELTR